MCKGAYAEPDELAYQSRSDVNDAFDRLATTLMHGTGAKPAMATHDDGRIRPVLTMAASRTEPWEFQFLYGIRRDLQAELAEAGHEVDLSDHASEESEEEADPKEDSAEEEEEDKGEDAE